MLSMTVAKSRGCSLPWDWIIWSIQATCASPQLRSVGTAARSTMAGVTA